MASCACRRAPSFRQCRSLSLLQRIFVSLSTELFSTQFDPANALLSTPNFGGSRHILLRLRDSALIDRAQAVSGLICHEIVTCLRAISLGKSSENMIFTTLQSSLISGLSVLLFTVPIVCRASDSYLHKTSALAEAGDANAQNLMGKAFFRGDGVPQDYKNAAGYFRKSAEQGNAAAQAGLAYIYATGLGLTQNYEAAIDWYRKSAEQGNVVAQLGLASLLSQGKSAIKDVPSAAKWLERAADQSSVTAQARLAELYFSGDDGFEINYKESARWAAKAAEKGDAPAQNLLGVHYEDGYGIEKDERKAERWFRKAAQQGNAKAQSNLGRMLLSRGTRLKKDHVEGYQWLKLSFDAGEATAGVALEGFQSLLTPEEINEGKRSVEIFKKKAQATAASGASKK